MKYQMYNQLNDFRLLEAYPPKKFALHCSVQ